MYTNQRVLHVTEVAEKSNDDHNYNGAWSHIDMDVTSFFEQWQKTWSRIVPLGGWMPKASNLSLCVIGSTTASISWNQALTFFTTVQHSQILLNQQ